MLTVYIIINDIILHSDNQTRLITETGYSGIIEINHDGSWRGICDDGWGLNDATVACTQLGFRGAVRSISSLTRPEAEFWLTSVACEGHERYLDHCSFKSWDVPNCNRFEYAGIVCTPNGELMFVCLFVCLFTCLLLL